MFFVQGALIVLLAAALLGPTTTWKRILASLAALAGLYLSIRTDLTVALRSGADWWKEPMWRNLILFMLLFLGMMFRVTWDALERRNAAGGSSRVNLNRWDFVRPALVSLIVFQGVLLLAKTQELSWELALASFQNGFFWNTLFGRARTALEVSPVDRDVRQAGGGKNQPKQVRQKSKDAF